MQAERGGSRSPRGRRPRRAGEGARPGREGVGTVAAYAQEARDPSGAGGHGGKPRRAGARRDDVGPEEGVERAKQVMRRLLSVRMRSRRELELRLGQRRFSREVIRKALDDFERVGLVNDREFAGLFLESRFRMRPRSYSMLMHELRAKGLAEELIKEVINEYRQEVPEEELARKALKARLKSMKGGSPEQAKARAARFLAGRGFAPSLIIEVVKDI
jgi:regulatory protein